MELLKGHLCNSVYSKQEFWCGMFVEAYLLHRVDYPNERDTKISLEFDKIFSQCNLSKTRASNLLITMVLISLEIFQLKINILNST